MHSHTCKSHLAQWNFQTHFGLSTGWKAALCRAGRWSLHRCSGHSHAHTGLSATSPRDPRQPFHPYPMPLSAFSLWSLCCHERSNSWTKIHGHVTWIMLGFSNLPEQLPRGFCQVTYITQSDSNSVDNCVIFWCKEREIFCCWVPFTLHPFIFCAN